MLLIAGIGALVAYAAIAYFVWIIEVLCSPTNESMGKSAAKAAVWPLLVLTRQLSREATHP